MSFSDKEFQALLNKLSRANAYYRSLLTDAESVFFERYGIHPSKDTCEEWNQAYYEDSGDLTVRELDELMRPKVEMGEFNT